MAIYSYRMQVVSRSSGRSATAGAAYRGRMEITDERTGEQHDYSRAKGHLDHEVLVPDHAPDGYRDAESLWNRAELAERRKDAQVYREIVAALPHELTLEQNRELLRAHIQAQYVKRGMGAQYDIHAPDEQGDQRNYHAHIMLTTRAIEADGFAAKKNRAWNSKDVLYEWREAWANDLNRALERHGHSERVDHRTLTEQNVFREASQHLGPAASAMERRGEQTRAGEANRDREKQNQKLADLEFQQSVIEDAIDAEQARLEKQAQRQQKTLEPQPEIWDRDEHTRQQDTALIDAAARHAAEQARLERESQQGDQTDSRSPTTRDNTPQAPPRELALQKLDLEREFEADQQRERDVWAAKMVNEYHRDQAAQELDAARLDAEQSDTFFGRLFGKHGKALEHVEDLQLNLADIDRRVEESQGALDLRQREEREAFYRTYDDEFEQRDPRNEITLEYNAASDPDNLPDTASQIAVQSLELKAEGTDSPAPPDATVATLNNEGDAYLELLERRRVEQEEAAEKTARFEQAQQRSAEAEHDTIEGPKYNDHGIEANDFAESWREELHRQSQAEQQHDLDKQQQTGPEIER